jgi:alkylation response protein AidB-like acyl-CoA dehydrogenase
MVPRSDYTIEDTWHTVGLAGTGSKDLILDDAFIPAHRMVTFARLSTGGYNVHDAPIYRLPFATGVALGTLSPVLGMTQGALESFIETSRTRTSSGGATRGSSKAAESPVVQTRLAEAAGLLDAAKVLLIRDLEHSHSVVRAGGGLSVDDRVRNRRDYALAVDFCVKAMAALFASGGSSTIHLSNPVQRSWRDVNVAARHVGLSWDINSIPFGQVALGVEPKGQF